MKDKKSASSLQAEQAMQQVLQAERDAEAAIRECESEAREILHQAQIMAQRINVRADERITNMEMRHRHKLDRLIKDIEKEGAAELSQDDGQRYAQDRVQSVVEQLAAELCMDAAGSERGPAGD